MKWSIPERIVERARSYVNEKRVFDISANPNKKIWTAKVMGNEIYHVELDGTPKEEDFCECPYWVDHGYCKHTVAVELAMRDQGIGRVMNQYELSKLSVDQPDSGDEITEAFSRIYLKQNELTQIHAEPAQKLSIFYKLELQPITKQKFRQTKEVFALSLKIGFDRFYIVKDLDAFFQAYTQKGTYEINQKLVIDFNQVIVESQHESILAELKKVHVSNQTMMSFLKDNKSIFGNKKYLVLPVVIAEEMIATLKEVGKLTLEVDGASYHDVAFVKDQLPLSFDLFQDKESLILYIQNHDIHYLEGYDWLLLKNMIFQPTPEQMKNFQGMNYYIERYGNQEIPISTTNTPKFTNYVLPLLKKVGTVHLDEHLQEQFIEQDLVTEVLISLKDDVIQLVLDFIYGEVRISTDAARNENTHLNFIRDTQKELQISGQIEALGYQKTTGNYLKKGVKPEVLYHLFTKEIPLLESWATVQVDTALENMFLEEIEPVTTIDIQNEGSLLDVQFDVAGITPDEVDEILTSLIEKKAFHRFDNGTILSLETQAFQEVADILKELRVDAAHGSHEGKVTIPSYQGLALHEKLEKETHGKRILSRKFNTLLEDLNHPNELEVNVPTQLNATLRSYQLFGFKWLKMLAKYGFGGILADDMGLGKTLQTITFILLEIEEEKAEKPFLILAPASLIYNWAHEFEKFAPQLKTVVVTGSAAERKKLIAEGEKAQIIITSYPSFRQDAEIYEQILFDTLILDESQMVKNYHTKTAQAITTLRSNRKFALSGTPIENKIEELWAIFQLIMPGFFPNLRTFKGMSHEQIAKMVQPFILRRIKKDVLKDLPDKIETNLYSSLTKEQKTIYLGYLKRIQESVQGMNHDDFKRNRIEILAGLTRLRQICCDPRLFIENYEGESGKLEQLKEILQTAKENGKRVLLFSQFTSMLSLIQEELTKLNYDTFYLHGGTKPKERIDMVNQFNEGEKDVFLISLKAGGTGLNLTGADTVILYDLWWNPAVEEQAAGRAHRIGQKNVVQVMKLIATGTIEEKIMKMQQEKKDLFDQVIESSGDGSSFSSFTEEDIRDILSLNG